MSTPPNPSSDDLAREQSIRDEAFIRDVSEAAVRAERDRNLAWAEATGLPPAPEMSPVLLAMMREYFEPLPAPDLPPRYKSEPYPEPHKVFLELWMLVGVAVVGGLWCIAVAVFGLGYLTSFVGALASILVGMLSGFSLATKRKYGTWWV